MSTINTIQEFLEYADVYEYSQDHFDMERMLMELTLVDMHLKSYDFLREAADITVGQIDHLMVESGMNDRSYYTEQVFVEKGLNIVAGIKKILTTIGKAIATFFKKIANLFKEEEKAVEEIQPQVEDTKDKLSATIQAINTAELQQTVQEGQALIQSVVGTATDIQSKVDNMFQRLDAVVGGGGIKLVDSGINTEDIPVLVIMRDINALSAIPGMPKFEPLNDKMKMFITLCSSQYDIETIAFIVDMETIVSKLNELLDVKGDLGSEDNYNSFWKIVKKFGVNGMFERIQSLQNEIMAMTKRNKRMTVTSDILDKKVDTANKLNNILEKLAMTSDIGPEANGTMLDTAANIVQKNDTQVNRKEYVMNDFKQRYNTDKNVYGDRGWAITKPAVQGITKAVHFGGDRTNYINYLRAVNGLATTLQAAVRDSIKVMTTHMQMRRAAVDLLGTMNNGFMTIVEKLEEMIKEENAKKAASNPEPSTEDQSSAGKENENGGN